MKPLEQQVAELQTTVTALQQYIIHLYKLQGIDITVPQNSGKNPRTETGMGPLLSPDSSDFV